jgi:hypothetical protein
LISERKCKLHKRNFTESERMRYRMGLQQASPLWRLDLPCLPACILPRGTYLLMTIEKSKLTHTQQGSIILRICMCCCSRHAAPERSLTLRARYCRTSWGSRKILTSLLKIKLQLIDIIGCRQTPVLHYWSEPLTSSHDAELNCTPSTDEPPYSTSTPRLEQCTRSSIVSR